MPLDFYIESSSQMDSFRVSFFIFNFSGEHPVVRAVCGKILPFYPGGVFAWVSSPTTTVVDSKRDDVCNDRAWQELDGCVATSTTPSDAAEPVECSRRDTRRADGPPGH